MKKYKLVPVDPSEVLGNLKGTSNVNQVKTSDKDTGVYRVVALKNFGDVKAGDIGGIVHNKDALSQDGNCWVYFSGIVEENARVFENARIKGRVSRSAKVYGNANVNEGVFITGKSQVRGRCHIYGQVMVSGDAIVEGNAYLKGYAIIRGNARIKTGTIGGKALIEGNAVVDWKVTIEGKDDYTEDIEVWNKQEVSKRPSVIKKSYYNDGYFPYRTTGSSYNDEKAKKLGLDIELAHEDEWNLNQQRRRRPIPAPNPFRFK